MRHPIDRLLAFDGVVASHYGYNFSYLCFQSSSCGAWSMNPAPAEAWAYANDGRYTDNYALRILAANDNSSTGLERAKQLLRRFTFVLDQACLDASLHALADKLGWKNRPSTPGCHANTRPFNLQHSHPPFDKRIADPKLLRYLEARNHNDIRLYEWARGRSLLPNCDHSTTYCPSLT